MLNIGNYMSVKRQIILNGTNHESTMGFAQASRIDDLICVSGTGPCDENGNTVFEGNAYLQAQKCIEAALESVLQCGGTIDDVIRTRIFITKSENWETVASAHKEFFKTIQPACSMIVTNALIDPKWLVQVEIDAYVKAQ